MIYDLIWGLGTDFGVIILPNKGDSRIKGHNLPPNKGNSRKRGSETCRSKKDAVSKKELGNQLTRTQRCHKKERNIDKSTHFIDFIDFLSTFYRLLSILAK